MNTIQEQETVLTEFEEKKKKFINERIVPRKPYKKLLSFGVMSIILGLLFGVVAGISFYVSQGMLKKNSTAESLGETIVIARDQDPQSSTEEESTEAGSDSEEAAQSTTEWSADIRISEAEIEPLDKEELMITEEGESSPAPGHEEYEKDAEAEAEQEEMKEHSEDSEETEENGEAEPEGDSAESLDPEDSVENGNTPEGDEESPEGTASDADPGASEDGNPSFEADEEAGSDAAGGEETAENEGGTSSDSISAFSLRDMYNTVANGFVTVTIKDSAGTDLFGKPVTSRRDQFGVIIFESEEYVYILTDNTGISVTSEVTMAHMNRKIAVTIQGQDKLTNLMVLRARRQDFRYAYTVLGLGNSFMVSAADYVWMAGSPDGKPGAVDYGIVTYANRMDEVTDGYRQLFTTNMPRSEGGSAVLFNKSCEIIGWISDYSCGDSDRVYAVGISPLKYVIEDLCSAVNTSYLGIKCLTVNAEKSEETGLSTGLYVVEVEQNSPCYMMGIQAGDRIISINDYIVNDSRTLQDIIDRLQSGKEIVLMIERQGRVNEEPLKVVLFVGTR